VTSESWVPVPAGSVFSMRNLPFGVFRRSGHRPRIGVAIGDQILAMAVVAELGLLPAGIPPEVFRRESLNDFLALGQPAWEQTRNRITQLLSTGNDELAPASGSVLVRAEEVEMVVPIEVGDYVDFYSSRYHAENVGRLFRPDEPPLPAAWLHLPMAYHGRAGTVVVSGTPVRRPTGIRAPAEVGPTKRLDFELEVGFVTGPGNRLGEPISVEQAEKHIFGFVLVNDWSARDIQAFEARPLGPFLGKSFATSISPWVIPLDALNRCRVRAADQDPPPASHLQQANPWTLDIELEVMVERGGVSTTVCNSNYRHLYWTPAQQLAHATSNGASFRAGDLFASGTISGPVAGSAGSLLEATADGVEPIRLNDGSPLYFLEDDDRVVIRGLACAGGELSIGMGEVSGQIHPARS
jgi:fumarylacetoacetase